MVERGDIAPIEVELAEREQPLRALYGTPGFIAWLRERLNDTSPSPLFADVTPAEQLDDLFYTFVSGRRLLYNKQFRAIRAERNAVWELKTPDLRVFGWFLVRDCFVGVFGDWADRIKDHNLYRGYRLEIRRLRRHLGVEQTLCVTGVAPSDVVSD